MKYYHTAHIRHKIKLKDGQVQTVLQVRSLLCFWTDVAGTSIDFELRPDPQPQPEDGRQFIRLNPSVSHYHMGGSVECWNESTFDLKKRLFEIANEYIGSMNAVKEYSSELEKQMAEL